MTETIEKDSAMKKRLMTLTVSIAAAVCLLASCGSSSGGSSSASAGSGNSGSGSAKTEENAATEAAFGMLGNMEFAKPISEEMLYGIYRNEFFGSTNQVDERINDSITNLAFTEREIYPGKPTASMEKFSKVPVNTTAQPMIDLFGLYGYNFAIEADWQRLYGELAAQFPGHEDEYLANLRTLYHTSCIEMQYAAEDSSPANMAFYYTYTLDGNTMHCRRVQDINDDFTIKYLDPAVEEDYHIGFQDDSLLIEQDGCVVTLLPLEKQMYAESPDSEYRFSLYGSIDTPEHAYQNIVNLSLNWDGSRTEGKAAYVTFADGSHTMDAVNSMPEPNTVTVSWNQVWNASNPYDEELEDHSGEITFRFLSVFADKMTGFFLIDDAGNVYPYIYEDNVYYTNTVGDNLGEGVSVDSISDDKKEELAADQNYIVSQIKEGFSASGILADVDEKSGTIRFDSNILFAVDSADVSEEGKKGLDEFLSVYVPIMKEQAENGIVANIQIDGHTDTSGAHDYNQDLSERRAAAVADYVSAAYPEIAPYIIAKGYSFDKPIFAADGTVDMDASRRVEFRFIMNVN